MQRVWRRRGCAHSWAWLVWEEVGYHPALAPPAMGAPVPTPRPASDTPARRASDGPSDSRWNAAGYGVSRCTCSTFRRTPSPRVSSSMPSARYLGNTSFGSIWTIRAGLGIDSRTSTCQSVELKRRAGTSSSRFASLELSRARGVGSVGSTSGLNDSVQHQGRLMMFNIKGD